MNIIGAIISKELIRAIGFTAVSFVVPLMVEIYFNFERSVESKSTSVIIRMGNKFISNRNGFDFEEKKRRLIKSGVMNIFPDYIKPHVYLMTHLIASIGGMVILYLITIIVGAPPIIAILGLMGWAVPDILIDAIDKSDLDDMAPDILTLLNVVSSQISGGVYIGNAFETCEKFVKHKRMKKAIKEFLTDIQVSNKPIKDAIDDFGQKFNSDSLSTFCTILKQYEETGYALDAIKNLQKQIAEEEEMRFEAQKAKIDNSMTIVTLILFGSLTFFLIYIFLSNMSLNF